MLLGRVAYACVLLRDLVDKRVRRSLERIDPLRVVAITHGVVHRARGVEHQHDIERLRDLRLQVRRGRKRRERREEIRLGAFLDRYRSVRPCQSDALGRYRLVGPDAADALGRVIQTPIPPRARRIGVGHRVLVACGIGRGSCARRARSRRSAFIGERERRHADGQREKRRKQDVTNLGAFHDGTSVPLVSESSRVRRCPAPETAPFLFPFSFPTPLLVYAHCLAHYHPSIMRGNR